MPRSRAAFRSRFRFPALKVACPPIAKASEANRGGKARVGRAAVNPHARYVAVTLADLCGSQKNLLFHNGALQHNRSALLVTRRHGSQLTNGAATAHHRDNVARGL